MKRDLGDGCELDDDPALIDREAVYRYLTVESYWAKGRSQAVQDELIDNAARVVGPYHEHRQIAFTRALSDGHTQSYLADVYVLEEHRGLGLGVELVRFSVDEGPLAETKWFLQRPTRTTSTASSGSANRATRLSSAGPDHGEPVATAQWRSRPLSVDVVG